MDSTENDYTSFISVEKFRFMGAWRGLAPAVMLVVQILVFGILKIWRLFDHSANPFVPRNLVPEILIMGTFLLSIILTLTRFFIEDDSLIGNIKNILSFIIIPVVSYIIAIVVVYFESVRNVFSPSFTLFWFLLIDIFRISLDLRDRAEKNGANWKFSNIPASFVLMVANCVIIAAALFSVLFLKRKVSETFYSPLKTKQLNDLLKERKLVKKKKTGEKVVETRFGEKSEEIVETEKQRDYKSISKKIKTRFPEGIASILSVLTFNWITKLLLRGNKRPLEDGDLMEINESLESRCLAESFLASIGKRKDRAMGRFELLWMILKTFKNDLLYGAFLKLLNDLIIFVNPLLLKKLIDERQINIAILMLLTTIISTILLNQYFSINFTLGVKIKIYLMNIIYRKSLTINPSEKQKLTTGEIVNLMSVDSNSFLELIPYINILWSGPLQIGIGIYLLYREIKYSSFVGLGIMIMFMVPGNTLIVWKMKKLQKFFMEKKDIRLKITSEVLSSIKIIKMYAWEKSFKEKISGIRKNELKRLKRISLWRSLNVLIWTSSSILVIFGTLLTYIKLSTSLNEKQAFTTISLLNIVRFPIIMLPSVINMSIISYVALGRLSKYISCRDSTPRICAPAALKKLESSKSSKGYDIFIENTTFFWSLNKEKVAIDFNGSGLKILSVNKGSLVTVIGPVGSGKSALLLAILGELQQENGNLAVNQDIAYVSQTAWIQNATIRENILFGEPMNKNWYKKVLWACCLEEDLKVIKGGENAEIGERGINLSGGQKQRISLARAVYSRKTLYLIDDALSAVDPKVAGLITDRCLIGILKNKTRLFCTNSIEFLKHSDKVVVMEKCEAVKETTYSQLKKTGEIKALEGAVNNADWKNKSAEPQSEDQYEEKIIPGFSPKDETDIEGRIEKSVVELSIVGSDSRVIEPTLKGKLIEEEEKKDGGINMNVYKTYISSYGWTLFFFILVFFGLRQVGYWATRQYLAWWINDNSAQSFIPNTSKNQFARDYTLIIIGCIIFIALSCILIVFGALRSSRIISKGFLKCILRAPMAFFDTTPRGRILNRFSQDISTLDSALPVSTMQILSCFSDVLATIIIISASLPYFMVSLIPLFVIYYFIQRFFLRTIRKIKRITSIRSSPIYSTFQETLEGASVIKAFSAEKRFIKNNEETIDNWTQVHMSGQIINRWLSFRLDCLGSVVVGTVAMLIIFDKTIKKGQVGVLMSFALMFIGSLNWMIRSTAMAVSQIVSVERIMEYSAIPSEAPLKIPSTEPDLNWPSKGTIEFKSYKMRYRPELDLVLRGVDCEIKSGEKVGIIGRTGAGKSSLFNCILRLNEADSGSIWIDGVDIKIIGLQTLRSKITVIPQDPVMFAGSLKFNIDPFDNYTDEEIWHTLEICQIKKSVEEFGKGGEGLEFEIEEGGSNLSSGERQLICIARGLLRKSRIFLLDEATSSIDVKTDEKIQATIRNAFKGITVLTIAHRLNTIMDSDRILVMENGCVAQFDSPEGLMSDKKGIFYSVVTSNQREDGKDGLE